MISLRQRFEVLRRDGFACVYCGATPPEGKLQIDHVYPVSRGGTDEIDNLVTACFACNMGKHAMDLDEYEKQIEEATEVINCPCVHCSILRGGPECWCGPCADAEWAWHAWKRWGDVLWHPMTHNGKVTILVED